MSLPLRLPWDAAQDRWATIINPIVDSPIPKGILLQNIALAAGSNTVNHRLSRNLIGWIPTRIRASATLYDTQDTNQTPQLTLTIVASAPVVVDLWVF